MKLLLRGAHARQARGIRFLVHLKAAQVMWRFHLAFKRRVMVRIAWLRPGIARAPARARGVLRAQLPARLFPPRTGRLTVTEAGYRFTFLNDTREMAHPIDWRFAAGRRDQLWMMNLHYMEYLEEVGDDVFMALVEGWIEANPLYRAGCWHTAWNTYAVSIRAVVWLQQIERRRAILPEAFLLRVTASLEQQLNFVAANLELDVLGNHLIKNLKALLLGAAAFTGPAAERWRQLALRHLARQLDEQILPDGCHYERSASYHGQVFADLLECSQALDDPSLRRRLGEVLERMARATRVLAHPDGGPALFNDSGLTMAYPPEVCLAVHARAFGRDTPLEQHLALPQGGYFGFRHGEDYVLVDCGDIAPDFLVAHGHGDLLSFESTVRGRRLVVDPGVFEYVAGPWRAWSRSTASHNTVTVGEEEQCEFFGAFRCGRRARARCHHHAVTTSGFVIEGTHDGFRHLPGRPRHVRRFEVSRRGLSITDRVEEGRGQAVRARLLFHPDWRIEVQGREAWMSQGPVTIHLNASAPLQAEPAWWCPDMGVRLRTARLVVEYGGAPCHGELAFSHPPRHAPGPEHPGHTTVQASDTRNLLPF